MKSGKPQPNLDSQRENRDLLVKMPLPSVAVIDIGSNSIKVLVATRDVTGEITPLKVQSIDARISAGISKHAPSLSAEGMARGLEAIRELLSTAAEFNPSKIALVATSAVRDASNEREFCEHVRTATGHSIRILTGDEEANLIGRGLTTDPTLRELRDFYVFDLGGGSLECLAFRNREIEQAASLRLGCVRLTEKFVPDPSVPLSHAATQNVIAHTREVLALSDFKFALPASAIAVGSGGTLTTVRAIFGAREAKPYEATEPIVPVADLRKLLDTLGEMPLARRKQISGLPRARADVFPVALATLIAIADAGNFGAYHHSIYNLRYGLAAELLN
jgi:exopolyphosphatase / guanosine-5'-triphosphate,3'-diphosphate pyrophosphatase